MVAPATGVKISCFDVFTVKIHIYFQVPIYLAAGTAAQQLDASFSTNSNLEVYALNLTESGHDMPLVASLPVDQRYHKLVWGGGAGEGAMPSGLIVGGADRGVISM